ncbi:MAG: hypothetical protein LBF75_11560 [Treponema sp.]|nr:hypothetical protein [Treponema sp.]
MNNSIVLLLIGQVSARAASRYGTAGDLSGGAIITSIDGMKTEALADRYSALEEVLNPEGGIR